MKSRYLSLIFSGIWLGLLLVSCSKMNDLHDEYLKWGETIYVGQPDSAKVFAGIGRVKLCYWTSDPKAKKIKIYWNSRADSLILDVPSKPKTEAKEVLITDLPENKYYFELVTMNMELKYPSIPFEVSGAVYGPIFQKTLLSRDIMYATFANPDEVFIKLYNPSEKSVATEILYDDLSGNIIKKFLSTDEFSTVLEDFQGNLRFRTSFLPEAGAIDTFYSEFKPIKNIDKKINESQFAKWNPQGIPYYESGASYSINNLWDNAVGTFYIQTAPKLPHSFTFDLGQQTKISRIKQWQRLTNTYLYRTQNVQKFELWGSSTAEVTADFSGWKLLGVYESKKPSGLPLGQESDEDIAYATAGEDFIVLEESPVRYIRYVVTNTWDSKLTIAISELSFFNYDN